MPRGRSSVREAVVGGERVLVKLCRDCGAELPVEEFWRHGYTPGGSVVWSPVCGRHMAERARRRRRRPRTKRERELALRRARHAERMATDPEFRERKRRTNKRAMDRWLADPENAEAARQASIRYHRKLRKERRGEVNEQARLYYHVKREQAGRPRREVRSVVDGTRPRLPLGPFRRWLERYRDWRGIEIPAMAAELRLEERRLRAYLADEQADVAFDVVDRALINAASPNGPWRIEALYPEQVIVKATRRTNRGRLRS